MGEVDKPAPAPEPQGSEEYPTIQSAVDEWVEYWKRSEDQPQDIERKCPWGSVARAYLALRAQLAQAREERDKFEAESEQKGADLMAAEGVIAEIIGAHERSASSELGQLIEDARAARAKESQ